MKTASAALHCHLNDELHLYKASYRPPKKSREATVSEACVSHSVHRSHFPQRCMVSLPVLGRMLPPRVCLQRGSTSRAVCLREGYHPPPPPTALTFNWWWHPTRMHSCYIEIYIYTHIGSFCTLIDNIA